MNRSRKSVLGSALAGIRRRARAGLPAALLLCCWSARVAATPEYPLVIDAALEVSCPRPNSRCLICHTTARGGQRTAEQLFALTLRDYGLTRGREGATLQNALLTLSEEIDSDGDGEPDKEELRVCGNPSGEELGIGPEYGCDGAHLARHVPSDAPLALLAISVASVLVRRRRGASTEAAIQRRERDLPGR